MKDANPLCPGRKNLGSHLPLACAPHRGGGLWAPGEGRLLTVGRLCPAAQALAQSGGVYLHPFLRSLVVGVDVRLSKPQPLVRVFPDGLLPWACLWGAQRRSPSCRRV